MPDNASPRMLSVDDLRLSMSVEEFGFETTVELKPLDQIVGQPRAMEALDLGVGIRHRDYHIYAAGMTGTGKLETITQALEERVGDGAVPGDWIYLNNFDEPDHPVAISLPAGDGIQFKRAMQDLIENLCDAIPKAFREEDFGREKEQLRQQYRKRGEEILTELDTLARRHAMSVQQLPDGKILFIPLKDDRPMTPEEVQQLPPEQLQELEAHQEQLFEMAGKAISQQHEMERQLSSDVREVARSFAARLIEPLVAEILKRFDTPKLRAWLERLKTHLVEHLDRFRERSTISPALAAVMGGELGPDTNPDFVEYEVNLLVDNRELKRAPIIVEEAPNYKNLFGTIGRVVDRFGRVATNFSRIKAGSLLRANGGYLVFDLMDALTEPFVWKELKRTLKSATSEIEAYDPFSIFSVSALKPEPIPLDVKLVAAGTPLVYHLLCLYDEDFSRIFRVKADFDNEMVHDAQAARFYGQFIRKLSDAEGTLPFNAEAVAELIRSGARLAGKKQRVSTEFSQLGDIVREADYWCRRDSNDVVTAGHVRKAIEKRVYRSDMIAGKIRELIADGTLLIEVREPAVGQVNLLAVADLGDLVFGRPSRMTASVGVGAAGIVNIEHESRLSGQTFDKGLLILEGYLRNKYSQEQPLTLSASIAVEQSYGGIDGDSASIAELLCLLSALADVSLRQNLAVTGSINQWGQVQAIGGVNEKVEGFFDVCRELGLSGDQGVCIPEANVKNLVLRSDVVETVERGQFHLWAIKHVDQAIELFTGLPAGDLDIVGSFHSLVANRLSNMLETLKSEPAGAGPRLIWTPGTPTELPPDPRPPLPGN